MSTTVMSEPKVSLTQRINPKMLVILVVVACLIGYPVYVFVSAMAS